MGDRTCLNLVIHDNLPKAHLAAVRAVFEDYGTPEEPDPSSLELMAVEAPLGAYADLADELVELMAGDRESGREPLAFSFDVWSDPKYEYLGGLVKHRPGHHRFSADCDANGQALLTDAEIDALLTDTADADLRSRLRLAAGLDLTPLGD